ncbi:hypothetical protein H0Z09_19385 [Pseudomonas sp. SWRI18]|uniref:hypothetical protein n=1 Tax=Pseudomonas sp. SWRI18 TaxID=2753888 RepID=UPI0016452930|nr:hypothetical protein [Pseudomonas sp. SWRI18]MBC3303294.1 hypothetical protein [Pseudomonas sp. SWRI18]
MFYVRRSELLFGVLLMLNFVLAIFVMGTMSVSGGGAGDILYKIFLISMTVLLGRFCLEGRYKSPLSIPSLVSISVFFFMWARPFLTLFFNKEVVEAGIVLGENSIRQTVVNLALGFIFIATGYLLSGRFSSVIVARFATLSTFSLSRLANGVIIFLGLSSGVFFLVKSFIVAQKYIGGNYFEALENPEFHAHIFTFFIAKNLLLLWGILGKHSNRLMIISIIWMVFSIGFLFIGLRGYFFVYLFLFIFVYGLEKRISYGFLILLGVGSLFFANILLEYRLGFQVSTGVLEKISQTLHGQGASFEVLYGAVNFSNELERCLNSTTREFGVCVDQVRYINFASGGFSTSFFAEAYYRGWVFYMFWCLLFGCFVRILDGIVFIYKEGQLAYKNQGFAIFLILSVLPTLVYFSRSDMYGVSMKFLQVGMVVFVLSVLTEHIKRYRGVPR